MKRTVLKIAGASGMGLLSVGKIVSRLLKQMGYYVNVDREFPSLIKGGHSNLQIDFGLEPIYCSSNQADLVIALDRAGLLEYIDSIKEGGILVYGYERHHLIKELQEKAEKRNIHLVYMPARTIAYSFGGSELMVNMVLSGLIWRVLGLDLAPLKEEIEYQFATKPKLLAIDLKCMQAGYDAEGVDIPEFELEHPSGVPDKIMLDGNMAIALGAIHCGVRAYYAYPMSPASSILNHLANHAQKTGMLVKQAEDEITAAQMTIGSMHMGARAFTATSGGGFDLMTETVSLSGITETPLVIVIAQRPGPGTGLPTWTSQGDLNLAIHAGHGEFARIVIACSDPTSAYELIQQAMNRAEKYQTLVILLTEKTIAEAQMMVDPFEQKTIPIERGLVTDPEELEQLKSADRFELTESGISKRWIPGSSNTTYYANGDEHEEDGSLTEEAEPVRKMIDKRLRKLETIRAELPDPIIHGTESGATISFIGWGSSKNVMRDIIPFYEKKGVKVNYLHFDYVYPLKTEKLKSFFAQNPNIHLIEGNYFGQFGNLVESKADVKLKGRLLKYDGRPFFLEDVMEYIDKNI